MEIIDVVQLPTLAPRAADSNKGDFGKVLVLAGSRGMSGAAVLCGSAALRAGAGLVRVATPQEIQTVVAIGNACYTTVALPQDTEGRIDSAALPECQTLAENNDVLALGPGLGKSPGVSMVVAGLVGQLQKPIVLDADGLNALADQPDQLKRHAGPLVITPHPGEFARLTGLTIAEVQAQRREIAVRCAQEHRLIVVLKGNGTIVTDGQRFYRNASGNPGMATGGTGDVLTGIIAALIGQGMTPFDAAVLGVHLHGLAGDLARDEVGEVSLIARDLLDHLPGVLRKIRSVI